MLLANEGWDREIARCPRWSTPAAARRCQDIAIFTSRRLVTGADAESSLAIGRQRPRRLKIVRAITTQPRYLLAKGGITSSDTATLAA